MSKNDIALSRIEDGIYDLKKYTKQELFGLLKSESIDRERLFLQAKKRRTEDFGKVVYIRGVMDISNYCVCSCKFCGNNLKSNISRYRMKCSDIIKAAENAKEMNIDIVHIASGEDIDFSFDDILEAVQEIHSMGLKIELALGNKTEDQLCKLREAGADRFILKFETTDNELFSKIKICTAKQADIFERIAFMKSIGFNVGSGNIIGLPGQTEESVVNDLLKLDELKTDMASTSVFMPNSESEFANEEKGNADTALNFIALLRIFMKKKVCIPSNSTLGTDGKRQALEIGANLLTLNITPSEYNGKYSIYTGMDRYKADIETLNEYIASAGMKRAAFSEMFNE